MKVVAIIPIKHNSQRLPGKNWKILHDKPLYWHIIDTLLKVDRLDHILINTDSQVIRSGVAVYFDNPRIKVIDRPVELCSDMVSVNKIIKHTLGLVGLQDDDIVIQTHTTNPLLSAGTINLALDRYLESCDIYSECVLMSVTEVKKRYWNRCGHSLNHNPTELLQTQDLEPIYEENSCIYLFRKSIIDHYGHRLGYEHTHKVMFPISYPENIDIDTTVDFKLATLEYRVDGGDQKGDLETTLRSIDYPEVGATVLITAPYMMPKRELFKKVLSDQGYLVKVANVQERLSEEELLSYGRFDVLVCGDDYLTSKVLEKSGCKAVCKWGTGIDSLTGPCQEMGVPVYNTTDAFTVPVSQSVIGAALALIRGTWSNHNVMIQCGWDKVPGRTLQEIVIGIVGMGCIGKKVAAGFNALGCDRILGCDLVDMDVSGVQMVNYDQLLSQSDMICLCSTLNDTSYHILDSVALGKVKKGVLVTNMARGKLVEETALIKALEEGVVGGAALDVFEDEPLPSDSPLRRMNNVILSSHNSNSSQKYWNYVHVNTIRNVARALYKK